MFDSRSETRDVQGKPVISYLKARKLSKTTAIMSKGHRSQLKEDPVAKWNNLNTKRVTTQGTERHEMY